MTYCLGIMTRFGLVMAADSRTNAGVDYISTYQKLFDFSVPDERTILLCMSGNLSITQSVLTLLRRDLKNEREPNLHSLSSLHEVATYLGNTIRDIQNEHRQQLERDGIDFQCNFLLGGQTQGEDIQLYQIYTQGNYIEATPETPFLQIGETKYGKPILDRTLTFDTRLEAAAKCALLSIDSTMRSNISVGPPINMVMYEKDSFHIRHQLRLRLGDPYLAHIRKLWEIALKEAFGRIPNVEWELPDSDEDIYID
ncbi:MAG: proteasome-type protease [Cyanobacteria bacterium J06642_2]